MNSRQVECTLAVAKTLNFNRAANELYISQPTLSHHIQSLEAEVGFKIFDRSNRKVALTSVVQQFCNALQSLNADLQTIIERCQNYARQYSDTIRISIFTRTALLELPEVMYAFRQQHPEVFIDPIFDNSEHRLENFLAGQSDIIFSRGDELQDISGVEAHLLYDSRLKLVLRADDPLADQGLITPADLQGRTLLVGGGSPQPLRDLQQKLKAELNLATINSHDHSTTLTYVAAGEAVCLSPDLYEDDDPTFIWKDFAADVNLPCCLFTHDNCSPLVTAFVRLLCQAYQA